MDPFDMTAAGVRGQVVSAWGRRALRQLSAEIGVVFDGPTATVRGSFADVLRLRERLMNEAPSRSHQRPPRVVDDERVYFCARCPFRARSIAQLTVHRGLHQQERKLYRCPHCSFVSFNKSLLSSHRNKSHGSQPLLPCDKCEKVFRCARTLTNHRRLAHTLRVATVLQFVGRPPPPAVPRPFSCHFCPRAFIRAAVCANHERRVHGEPPAKRRLFVCPLCPKAFRRRYHLVEHGDTHATDKSFCCEQCAGKFQSAASLRKHKRVKHAERTHHCGLCRVAFATASDLGRHRRSDRHRALELPASDLLARAVAAALDADADDSDADDDAGVDRLAAAAAAQQQQTLSSVVDLLVSAQPVVCYPYRMLFVSENKCPIHFDYYLCWPETAVNTTAQVECPAYINGIRYYTMRNVTRQCFANQTWSAKSDYSGCVPDSGDNEIPMFHLMIMYYMYWVGYVVSLVFLLFALSIFLHYKNLWCLRNIIHTNLVLCFTLHNLTWICYSFVAHELQLDPGGEGQLNLCVIPTTLLRYFFAAGFFWMFVEGFYLFVNVMFSFHAQRIRFWMCFIVGWGIPFVLILITAIAKKANFAQNCWDEQQHYLDYIFIGPVLVLLSVNLVFLFLIMYVVMAKLQLTVHAELERYKKGMKALLVLCPLLGINYVLVLFSPDHPYWLKLTFSYYCVLISSTQGLLVALFFCFRNNEVIQALSTSYTNFVVALKIRADQKRRRSNVTMYSRFGSTPRCSLQIPVDDVEDSFIA
uniref:Uncharacterized protein n=1 Tax=Plectus sambesii TaxID=2011161 RepID=A0A914WEH8_9BILA